MKRFILFIIITILVSITMLFSKEIELFEKLNVNELTIYTKDNSSDYDLSGNGYSFVCSVETYKGLTCDIDGVTFESKYAPEAIISLLNLKIESKQDISTESEDTSLYYCFLENLNNYVLINNKKVNIQISFDGEKSIIGIPLILGSY